MIQLFENKRILFGVTGSIACYKAADLASKLTQVGAEVDVILTSAAREFLTPLTFQSVCGRKAYIDDDLWGGQGHVVHIGLAREADLMIIAPASANTIAKLAHGIADNLLTLAALAAECQLWLAPAMDGGMYANPATQANISKLLERGIGIIGPAQGHLASGMVGLGRMEEPGTILAALRHALAQSGPLDGTSVLVTAGGTQEAIDPVRSITNRSSGKQGYALAQAALDLGARVHLISTPTCLNTPYGAERSKVHSADEMLNAVMDQLPNTDVLLMAAAVADFKPADAATHKIKRSKGVPTLQLETNPDILERVAGYRDKHNHPHVTVGFAAESQSLIENARAKMRAKQLDLIAANDISASDAGFESDSNRITLIDKNGVVEELPLITKYEVAEVILKRVVDLIHAGKP